MRVLLRVLFAVLLLFDAVMAYRLWWYGLPRDLRIIGEGATARLSVEDVPFTGFDWIVVAGFILIHVALSYAVWRTRLPSSR